MASKHNRSRKPKNNAPVGPKLAYELFSELNATFYQDDPSEYLLVKIEAVTLMLAPAEALAPAYASERAIGVTRHAGMPVPSKQTRRPLRAHRRSALSGQIRHDRAPDIDRQRQPLGSVSLAPQGDFTVAPVDVVEPQGGDLAGA